MKLLSEGKVGRKYRIAAINNDLHDVYSAYGIVVGNLINIDAIGLTKCVMKVTIIAQSGEISFMIRRKDAKNISITEDNHEHRNWK